MRLLSESLKLLWEKDKKKVLRTTVSKWNKMSKYLLWEMQLKTREERAWSMNENSKKFKNYLTKR